MTQVFKEDKVIPVTLIESGPNFVTQIKTKDKDGYESIQLNIGTKKRETKGLKINDADMKIGDKVVVTIVDIRGDKVRLGIDAPTEIPVHRREVYEAIQRENLRAAQLDPREARGLGGKNPAPSGSSSNS